MGNLQKDSIVTFGGTVETSKTFIIDTVEGETALLSHPLSSLFLMRVPMKELDIFPAKVKSSSERALDFVKSHVSYLDRESEMDFDALCLYFIHLRKFNNPQKHLLSNLMGRVAAGLLQYDLESARLLVIENQELLDEFNLMWYNNLIKIFSGEIGRPSEKHKISVFNIAAFVMAERVNPTISRSVICQPQNQELKTIPPSS